MSVRLLLFNPNTTVAMTDRMAAAARGVLAPGTELVARTAGYGPPSIEGYYDEAFSVPALLECIAAERGADGVVVGCFDDTGVDAARSLTGAPVIGICQAAMQAASVLANSFTVITTLQRSVPALEHLARRYGFAASCRRVRASEVPVLALEDPASGALERIREQIEQALEVDGAEAVVLGCAGMVDLTRQLTEEYSVPVIEGVCAAVKCVESLATLGLRTSRRGGYAPPRAKRYAGRFEPYSPG